MESGLDLHGDQLPSSHVGKNDIDPTADGVTHSDLRPGAPPTAEQTEKALHDRRLVSVPNRGTCVRVEPQRRVGPERDCEANVGLERRTRALPFDLGHEGLIDTRRMGERPLRETDVLAKAPKVKGGVVEELLEPSRGCQLEMGQ